MPPPRNVALTASQRATVHELKRLADQGVAIDAFGLLPAHAGVVARAVDAFGNLGAARWAAGLWRGTAIDAGSDVATLLRDLSDRGIRLTPSDLRRVGEDQLLKHCYARFGSWPTARAAARLPTPSRRRVEMPPRDHVLDALRGRAGLAGVLRGGDVDRDLARAARHHFGTVGKALDAAGVAFRKPNARWSQELLIDELARRVAKGESISISALRAAGRSDIVSAIQRHFDSVTIAQRRAFARASGGEQKGRARRGTRARVAALLPAIDRLVEEFVTSVFAAAGRRALDQLVAQMDTAQRNTSRRGRARE